MNSEPYIFPGLALVLGRPRGDSPRRLFRTPDVVSSETVGQAPGLRRPPRPPGRWTGQAGGGLRIGFGNVLLARRAA